MIDKIVVLYALFYLLIFFIVLPALYIDATRGTVKEMDKKVSMIFIVITPPTFSMLAFCLVGIFKVLF